ncbi:MAG TPA: hypothetical protein VK210_03630 [Terriglobia bacterium]|nr:hypothetical protein [Terriglobia bacterium]
MKEMMPTLIFLCGVGQLGVLIASSITPFQLRWKTELAVLGKLHRQMYWVYAGYVVLAIIAFALLSLFNADELAGGSALARGVCAYIAVFWGIRLALQGVFNVREHLSKWWLKLGYLLLTVLFAGLTVVYGLAALRPW